MDLPVTGRFRRWLVRGLKAAAAKKHELHRALQYNIGLKDHPVRENVAFPDRSTALCLLCDCTTSNAAGFPRYMGRSEPVKRRPSYLKSKPFPLLAIDRSSVRRQCGFPTPMEVIHGAYESPKWPLQLSVSKDMDKYLKIRICEFLRILVPSSVAVSE